MAQNHIERNSHGRVPISARTMPTMRVAYFFAGKSRKSSVGEELRKLCAPRNFGLVVNEVDILNGGGAHDLLDHNSQGRWESRVQDGEFDLAVITPPFVPTMNVSEDLLKPRKMPSEPNAPTFPCGACLGHVEGHL